MSEKLPFNIIVAVDSDLGIGKDGKMPWHLPGELKHFKDITCLSEESSKKNAVIMGRRTWESIPEQFSPLKGRINVVLSRSGKLVLPQGVLSADSLENAFDNLNELNQCEALNEVFVIGGQQVFEEAIGSANCTGMLVTHIENSFNCDTFFPEFRESYDLISSMPPIKEENLTYFFAEYKKK